ncbi:MAG: hypothetical protein U0235_19950 [Polyangiaceae bacterium]
MKNAGWIVGLSGVVVLIACSSSSETSTPAPSADAGAEAATDAATPDVVTTTDSATPGTACAGKTYTASCHPLAGAATTSSCSDYYGWDMSSAKLACPDNLGVLKTTPCDTASNVGSCEKDVTATVCARYWYFGPGYTTNIVQQGCPAPARFYGP